MLPLSPQGHGADGGNRTHNLLIGNQLFYQVEIRPHIPPFYSPSAYPQGLICGAGNNLERTVRVELTSLAWKAKARPLDHARSYWRRRQDSNPHVLSNASFQDWDLALLGCTPPMSYAHLCCFILRRSCVLNPHVTHRASTSLGALFTFLYPAMRFQSFTATSFPRDWIHIPRLCEISRPGNRRAYLQSQSP